MLASTFLFCRYDIISASAFTNIATASSLLYMLYVAHVKLSNYNLPTWIGSNAANQVIVSSRPNKYCAHYKTFKEENFYGSSAKLVK